MTYQEVNDRLTRVQTALQSLQDGSYANNTSINVPQMTSQLQEVEAKLKEQLLVLSEQEKGMVATDDEAQAEKLAKKGLNVKLTKEQEGIQFSVEETKAISREVGKAVAKGLKTMGDELASMKVKNIEEGSFDIHVQYKKDTSTDDFSFYITGDDLHLVDFSFDKVVGSVGVKPSGEPIVHVDVIANELVKHWSSQMKEGMSDEEWADAEQNQRLEDHPEKDMIKKIQALIAKEKNQKEQVHPGYARSSQSNQYAKRAKVAKPSPEEKERRAKEDQVFKDRLKKISGRLGIELREAPEGMFYLEVSIRDARKAMDIMDDMYRGQFEMNGSNVYYFGDESTAYDAMMDLGAQGIEIEDTNIEESVKENETPEGGMDQGGDLDVGHQDDEPNMLKKDLYDIATYAAKLYKQLDKYDKHDGEVDFPHWWQKKVTLAREYISSAQHYLEAEEKQPALDQLALEQRVKVLKEDWGGSDQHAMNQQIHKALGEPKRMPSPFDDQLEYAVQDAVDFHWDDWPEYQQDREGLYTQAKRAYLRSMFRDTFNKMVQMFEPANESLNEMADPSYADMLAQFIILMGSGYGALQAVKKLGDETGDISLDSVKKAIQKYKSGDVNEIGMFHDPVGYKKSTPEKPTYTKKFVSKDVYDIFKNGKKVKTIKGAEGEANAWMNNANRGQKNEGVGKSLADLKMGEKFTFNGKEYTFIELYPELENAARVALPDGKKTVVSFGGGKVNTGKKAGIGPDYFGQGKGHHIDEEYSVFKNYDDIIGGLIIRADAMKKFLSKHEPELVPLADQLEAIITDLENEIGDIDNASLNEAESTCCGKCGRKHVKGTKCKTPYLKGKDHCRTK